MKMIAALSAVALTACAPVASAPPVALGPQEVTVAGASGTLAGTLIEAGARTPAVLILPGSGPTDRDGNNALGVKGGAYRQLAEGLQAHGITTLRADKRGIAGSAKAMGDPTALKVADYVADTALWMDLVKARGHRCVWLAGHSEGGLIALAAAQQLDLCGLVLIAAPGRRMDAILHEQLAVSLPPDMLAATDKALAKLAAGEAVDPASVPAPVRMLFIPATQGYLGDMIRHDPVAMAARVKVPVLIVQGSEDLQVKAADASALSKAQPHATLETIAGMNHVFRMAPAGDRAANLKTYTTEGPIAARLVEVVAGFVNGAR